MMKYFLAAVMTVFLASCANQELGGTDPSCDYNHGVKDSEGYSTCSLDYKTKIHPWPDSGSTKNINFHCENGNLASATYGTSSDDIELDEESEEQYNSCRAPPVNGSCSLKFTNAGVSNHHVTTKSITCAPL